MPAKKKVLPPPDTGPAPVNLGRGNKYKTAEGRESVTVAGRRAFGKTAGPQAKRRSYASKTTAGTPAAAAEKPEVREIISPEDILAHINRDAAAKGRMRMDIAGHDWKTLGFRERGPDESFNQWIVSDDVAKRFLLFWALGTSVAALCEALKVSPWCFVDIRVMKKNLYEEAKILKAQMAVDSLEQDIVAVEGFKLPPEFAAILMRQRTWIAERANFEEFGNKGRTEVTGKEGGPIKIDQAAVETARSKLMGGSNG